MKCDTFSVEDWSHTMQFGHVENSVLLQCFFLLCNMYFTCTCIHVASHLIATVEAYVHVYIHFWNIILIGMSALYMYTIYK